MHFADFITGGLSAIVSRTLTAPLELFKMQRQNSFIPFSTIRDVIQKEGTSYLWKGNGTNCIRAFPQFAINYTIFEHCRQHIPTENKKIQNFTAGVVSGTTAIACIYPLETARSRLSLQTCHTHYSSLTDALRKMKFREMYGGLRMSLMGFGPYNAFSFMFYFHLVDILAPYSLEKNIEKLVAGGLSGVGAVSITYPTDLIRRRLQLQGFDSTVPRYSGISHCASTIIKKEGFRGLYRGLLATYIKLFPTTAIQFWTLEKCNELFKK